MRARQRKNLIAAAVAAIILVVVGLQWPRGGRDGKNVTALRPLPEEATQLLPQPQSHGTAELVALLPEEDRVEDSSRAHRSQAERAQAPSEPGAEASEDSNDDEAAKAPKAAREEDDPKHPLVVTPTFDLSLVPELNLGAPVSLSGRTEAYYGRAKGAGLSGSSNELIGNLPSLRLGSVEDTRSLAATIRADHPDAMPKTVTVYPHRWAFDGSTYVSRVRIRFEPIHTRLRLNCYGDSAVLQAPFLTADFDGSVRLIAIDRHGNVETIDQYGRARGGARKQPTLRYRPTFSEVLIVGIPNQESSSGDVIDPSDRLTRRAARRQDNPEGTGAILELGAAMRDIRPPRLDFRIVDPFEEPVKGAKIVAAVDGDLIARSTRSGGPVVIDGFVFVKEAIADALQAGQRFHGDQVGLMDLGFIRAGAVGATSANGKVSLSGLPMRPYEFFVRSPFGDTEPLLFAITTAEIEHTVQAPVVGLEVQCPLEWRKDEAGKKAWKRAKVKLDGRSRRLDPPSLDGSTRSTRRFLIRPDRPYTVTCTAKGFPDCVAKVTPRLARTMASVLPRTVEDKPEDGE